MRAITLLTVSITLFVLPVASPVWAKWDGTLKLGGIALDEEGDRSTVQETYNLYDGFSLSQIRLVGTPSTDTHLMLNLREINLDSRKGDLLFRMPSLLRVTASYDQHRQLFDPRGAVSSDRKDFDLGADVTPVKWLRLSGSFNYMDRDGDRLPFPGSNGAVLGTETASALGTGYDYSMRTGRLSAEARKDRRGAAVEYRATDFTDNRYSDADRTGNVVSARVWAPSMLYGKLTHFLRGAYGVSELAGGLDYTLSSFQYTGIVRPVSPLEFKYNFDAQRVDHEATRLKTDRYLNSVDATFYHGHGNATAGYSYEINDDDRRLTSYDSWRVGGVLRADLFTLKARYAGRVKKDTEELTLLKDLEASRILADLELRPWGDLTVGGGINVREREFPDIGVEAEGEMYRANVGYKYSGWGGVSGTYTYTQDEYTDLAAGYVVDSNVVTARVDLDRIPNAKLSGGVTYLDIGEDLDIEKSIVFLEAEYTVAADYRVELKYNVYNYDDYVILDRYYTANAVWFNFAYDFHVK